MTKDNFDVLLEFLQEENARWSILATMLKVSYSEAEALAAVPVTPSAVYMRTMLRHWMDGKCFTWEKLQRALKNIGYNALAQKLAKKGYSSGEGMYNVCCYYLLLVILLV